MSIIIVTYNNENHVHQLMQSIIKHVDTSRVPIVLIDNNSSDDTLELARTYKSKLNLKIISLKKNIGFGAANNTGMHTIDAEYYFLLNSDAYFIGPTIDQLTELLPTEPNIGVVGVPLVFPDGSPQTYAYSHTTPLKLLLQCLHLNSLVLLLSKVNVLRRIFLKTTYGATFIASAHRKKIILASPPRPATQFTECDWVCGAGMTVTRAFFSKSGGFDENIFLYGEDEDLCITAKKLGFRVGAATTTPVVHEFGWGRNRKNSHYSLSKRNSLFYFAKKHFSGLKRNIMISLIRWRYRDC